MTITYTEKGYGLHEAIQGAGHWLAEHDGTWISSDDVAVQAIIDGYTLDQAKEGMREQIEAYAKVLRDSVVAGISRAEMSSWPIKRAEAQGYPAPCPMLQIEADARGCTLAEIVAKVLARAEMFSYLEATISGVCGMHRDAIAAADSFAAVLAYDYSTGWPEV